MAGFQGVSAEDEITTLGRGGSDLTAVAMAAALKADVCEIYTDVDGVYTTDPNIVPEARKLDRISYDEMLELASLGAKVLQTRSVEYAKNYLVPVHVRSSFNDNPGTMVVKEDATMEKVVVSGIAYNKQEAKITITRVADRPGIVGAPVRPRRRGQHRRGHDRPEHQSGRLDRHLLHRAQDRLRAGAGDRACAWPRRSGRTR